MRRGERLWFSSPGRGDPRAQLRRHRNKCSYRNLFEPFTSIGITACHLCYTLRSPSNTSPASADTRGITRSPLILFNPHHFTADDKLSLIAYIHIPGCCLSGWRDTVNLQAIDP